MEPTELDEMLIPEESPLEQRMIPFQDDELLAGRTAHGIYVSIPGLCIALGMNATGQIQRMKRTANLARGLRMITLKTSRGVRPVTCLRLGKVPVWLAGVETSRLKPEIAAKIEHYQEELEPVAMQVFFTTFGIGLPATQEIEKGRTVTEQHGDVASVAMLLREHIEMSLSPIDNKLDYAISLLETLVQTQSVQDERLAAVDARTNKLSAKHKFAVKRAVDTVVLAGVHLVPPVSYVQVYSKLKHKLRGIRYFVLLGKGGSMLTQQNIPWDRFSHIAALPAAHGWLSAQVGLCAPSTILAYGRALEDYLRFCASLSVEAIHAHHEHIAAYVRDMAQRPLPHPHPSTSRAPAAGLANATMQQRVTVLRLFYDYLIEEGLRSTHPVGRGRYTPGKGFGGHRERGLIPHYTKLPWIPTEEEWESIIAAVKEESLRNRVMFALAYDAALRREEVCSLATGDIDPAHRLIHLRAETTKNRLGRVIPYSVSTGTLYQAYLQHRRTLSRSRGPLFLSESPRNLTQPLTIWTWSKVIHHLAERTCLPQLTTHTLRHLCLTDLARAEWDIHEIAAFAGHRTTQTTLLYIHLSGRDLAAKLERGMTSIHAWRVSRMEQEFAQ